MDFLVRKKHYMRLRRDVDKNMVIDSVFNNTKNKPMHYREVGKELRLAINRGLSRKEKGRVQEFDYYDAGKFRQSLMQKQEEELEEGQIRVQKETEKRKYIEEEEEEMVHKKVKKTLFNELSTALQPSSNLL